MPAKTRKVMVHSYHPHNCIPVMVLIPIGEMLDAIRDGKEGIEELASAHSEILKYEIRRIARKFKRRTG